MSENVTIVYQQGSEVIHVWESTSEATLSRILEACLNTGLVNTKEPLTFIAYRDSDDEDVFNGTFQPSILES